MKPLIKGKIQLLLSCTLAIAGCSKDNIDSPDEDITHSKYVTKLFEYVPAPGQFINDASFGTEEAAKSILGKGDGIVSLGAFGGYIVLGFDHAVINQKDMNDIAVYGNAQASFAEPGIVWVMQDENNNGLPDDTWYELKGSEYGKVGYIKNYEVTYFKPKQTDEGVRWEDNKDNTGLIRLNADHRQAYFPEWIDKDAYMLSGSLLPNTNVSTSTSAFVTSSPFAWGYADNLEGRNDLDINNAIDSDGEKVDLQAIDFIKIQTGILADLGQLGEFSTEIVSVEDLSTP
ncbi:cell surface protein [Olivibacter domesticus]|uniref:Cell surface protein n=1 Tax=Olivibacter domesticus TaxID=407022 RepID=A0A1H7ISH1_OLID1|nr:cell surface protein [Olivibacter domesticus]SEK65386.1 hypothetical protein SAMN05661044_00818 [Olivibacter domesticus]